MHSAELANRVQAARFVYTEDIRYKETLPNGALRGTNWVTYEVTFLEGEPYSRRIAVQGEPLSQAQAEEEESRLRKVELFRQQTPFEERRRHYFAAEENRFKIDTMLVLRYHQARFLGEQPIQGREAWVVETRPRRGAPKPRGRGESSLVMRIRYWIDKGTHMPIHIEAEWLRDFDGAPKGATVVVDRVLVDGAWLQQHIIVQGRRKAGKFYFTYENDQRYSNFMKFRADAKLLMDDRELH
ncbi:MAG: hypothetical protein J0H49_30610 [Acidobacteria bacterium]|nr:hypothetical protein [Acidobacteriota bacterium]